MSQSSLLITPTQGGAVTAPTGHGKAQGVQRIARNSTRDLTFGAEFRPRGAVSLHNPLGEPVALLLSRRGEVRPPRPRPVPPARPPAPPSLTDGEGGDRPDGVENKQPVCGILCVCSPLTRQDTNDNGLTTSVTAQRDISRYPSRTETYDIFLSYQGDNCRISKR